MKATRILLLSATLFMVIPLHGAATSTVIADEGRARQYCDTTTLQRIEGIWEFPSDDTRVLIRTADDTSDADYEIIVLTSADCRLTPGQRIGTITETARAGTFEMSLCRQLVKGVLTDPDKCVATLQDHDGSLLFKPRKFKISLRSMSLLPNFWKRLRFNITAPDAEIPQGMIRIYPVPYGSDTVERIYL